MTAPWFYQPSLSDAGAVIALDRDEAKHAAGAKRLRPGDAVTLFDGAGAVAHGVLASATRAELSVSIERVEHVETLSPAVTVAAAVPKGDRMATLLSQVTQLGAAGFIPLQCQRSVAGAHKWLAGRGERIMIEACKQSHNAHVPRLHQPCAPAELVRRCPMLWVAEQSAPPAAAALRDAGRIDHVTIAIGPEGGFTDSERSAMTAGGATPVALGPTTLRIETAAVALLSYIRLATSA